MANPWMTSDDLIASVQRKIAFPISQATFSNDDILAFANEEMFISQVPSVLQYHEEFFVTYQIVPLTTGINRYPIPDRAIGMRLRDIKWQDNQGNMFDMTRVSPDDKAFFQRNIGANSAVHKFYIEGNDIVLLPAVTADPTGQFVLSFFLRPNQLVTNDQAAIIQYFSQDITFGPNVIAGDNFNIQTVQTVSVLPAIGNPPYQSYLPGAFETFATNVATVTAVNSLTSNITSITQAGVGSLQITTSSPSFIQPQQTVIIIGSNTVPSIDGTYTVQQTLDSTDFTINFVTPLTSPGTAGTFTSPYQYLIGGTAIITATNFSAVVNSLDVIANASNGSPTSTNIVHLQYTNGNLSFQTNDPTNIMIPAVYVNGLYTGTAGLDMVSIPTMVYSNGMLIDFLQTNPGHRIFEWDVPILTISGNTIYFDAAALPVPGPYNGIGLSVGDYICPANECIIPNIPPDLHTSLAERTSARILASLGDAAGLQAAMTKIQEINGVQGTILDDRVEGTPQKVTARHSLLRYGKMGVRRRV
jgi:hypothetical protein